MRSLYHYLIENNEPDSSNLSRTVIILDKFNLLCNILKFLDSEKQDADFIIKHRLQKNSDGVEIMLNYVSNINASCSHVIFNTMKFSVRKTFSRIPSPTRKQYLS